MNKCLISKVALLSWGAAPCWSCAGHPAASYSQVPRYITTWLWPSRSWAVSTASCVYSTPDFTSSGVSTTCPSIRKWSFMKVKTLSEEGPTEHCRGREVAQLIHRFPTVLPPASLPPWLLSFFAFFSHERSFTAQYSELSGCKFQSWRLKFLSCKDKMHQNTESNQRIAWHTVSTGCVIAVVPAHFLSTCTTATWKPEEAQ